MKKDITYFFIIISMLIGFNYSYDINYYNQVVLLQNKIDKFEDMQSSFGVNKLNKSVSNLSYGNQSNELLKIKNILYFTGEIKDYNLNNHFNEQLYLAIKQFQINNNINADGKLNQKTISLLNYYSSKEFYFDLKDNLNRIKNNNYSNNMILVNLPTHKLFFYNGYNLIYDMNVIVGSVKHPSCIINNSHVENIVFNPSWYVPDSIARHEMIPKLEANPSYFDSHNFKILQNGNEVSPYEVDYTDYENIKFIQNPSSKNALGKIKFLFDNNCGIYLHDTNQRNLFIDSENQSLSHGCIRLMQPLKLANSLLGLNNIKPNEVEEYYKSDKTKQLKINPYQINIIYQNILVNENNELVLFKDIYNLN